MNTTSVDEIEQLLEVLRAEQLRVQTLSDEVRTQNVELTNRAGELCAQSEALETERELLAEATARLDSVTHSIRDGLIVFDRTGRAVVVNPVLRELFEILSDPIGWTAADFAREVGHCFADPAVPLEIARQAANAEAVEERLELELVRPTRRWMVRRSAPVRRPDGEVLGQVVVYHDVTERRESERLKDDFLALASHELRTPLTTIKAHAQMLLRRVEQADSLASLDRERVLIQLRTVDRQTGRFARLLNEMLDVSRIQSGRLQLLSSDFDLRDLTDEVVAGLRLAIDSHRLEVVRGAGPLSVRADPDRLEQILTNLTNNAVESSEAGLTVVVETVRTTDQRGRPVARLTVRDCGRGIAEIDLPRIFDAFYRTPAPDARRGPGFGLGLYISAAIARRHGGCLWAESRPGEGSSFHLDLPLAAQHNDEP